MAKEGRRVTLRVTAISHDCGDRFPHTLDWMARSLYLANGTLEHLLDEVQFTLQREDDPDAGDEHLTCWGIEEPDDRLVARVIAGMAITRADGGHDARDEDDGPVGAQATYEVQFTGVAFANALAPGATWESPCFDLALPTWWLRRGDERSRVVCDGDSWGHATTDAGAAWPNDGLEAHEDGGYAAASAFVEGSLRAGATLVWCNHVGEPSTWSIG